MSLTLPAVPTARVMPPVTGGRELFTFRLLREALHGAPPAESWGALSHPRTSNWMVKNMLERTLAAAPLLNIPVSPTELEVVMETHTVRHIPMATFTFVGVTETGLGEVIVIAWPGALDRSAALGIAAPVLVTQHHTASAPDGEIVVWPLTGDEAQGQALGEKVTSANEVRALLAGMIHDLINTVPPPAI